MHAELSECSVIVVPTISFAEADYGTFMEGAVVSITIRRDGGLDEEASATVSTIDMAGTSSIEANGENATAPDFQAVSETVVFAAGETSAVVLVTTFSDGVFNEQPETVQVALSSPSANAEVGLQSSSRFRIRDPSAPTTTTTTTTSTTTTTTTTTSTSTTTVAIPVFIPDPDSLPLAPTQRAPEAPMQRSPVAPQTQPPPPAGGVSPCRQDPSEVVVVSLVLQLSAALPAAAQRAIAELVADLAGVDARCIFEGNSGRRLSELITMEITLAVPPGESAADIEATLLAVPPSNLLDAVQAAIDDAITGGGAPILESLVRSVRVSLGPAHANYTGEWGDSIFTGVEEEPELAEVEEEGSDVLVVAAVGGVIGLLLVISCFCGYRLGFACLKAGGVGYRRWKIQKQATDGSNRSFMSTRTGELRDGEADEGLQDPELPYHGPAAPDVNVPRASTQY